MGIKIHILSQKKNKIECWEMDAEVKERMGQNDTSMSRCLLRQQHRQSGRRGAGGGPLVRFWTRRI